MNPGQLSLSLFTLVGTIMLVLAGTSLVYFLTRKKRSPVSQMLLWFFLCISLSAIATILTNLGLNWSYAFAPAQDAFLILGGVFLARFAYAYPSPNANRESRWVIGMFAGIAALALGYAFYFAWTYIASLPLDIDEIRAYYLLTPATMLGIILLLLLRSAALSTQRPPGNTDQQKFFTTLIRPRSALARDLRNLALALSIGLVPLIVFLIKNALPGVIASFFFNFGVVVSISAIMLVYLNMAPERTSITVRLVGISLVTILLLLGIVCLTILMYFPFLEVHRIVSIFIPAVLASSFFVLIAFPLFFQATLFKPLARLIEGVQAVDDGNFDIQIEVQYSDEVGYLTRSFNRMIQSIQTLTLEQQQRSEELEAEVSQRTEELRLSNQRLKTENEQREKARVRLGQQLQYEQALAECSTVLLSGTREFKDQQSVLTAALKILRAATAASRAYLFHYYQDKAGVERVGLTAEACAPGIFPNMQNPENQKFPLANLPPDLVQRLTSGEPIMGPTEQLFAGHHLGEVFKNQDPPLLSLLIFPLHLDQLWWGFIGFDDCESPRQWGESEIVFLRTASEMVGGTIHRWQINDQLEATLTELERRVETRTRSLNTAYKQLQAEISTRKKLQDNLEKRLETEQTLAKVSTRLVEAHDLNHEYNAMIRDLGELMTAGSVTLAVNGSHTPGSPPQIHSWYMPGSNPLSPPLATMFLEPTAWTTSHYRLGQYIFIRDIHQLPAEARGYQAALAAEGVETLILWPLLSDNEVIGILLVCNSRLAEDEILDNLQALEVFIRLLIGLLERDRILHTLELRVTEQARELSALYEITMLTSSSRDLSEILAPAISRVQEITKSEAACIHLFSPETETLDLIVHRGISPEISARLTQIPIQDPYITWLEQTRADHNLNQNPPEGVPEAFCVPGFQSMIQSKLRAAEITQGVISCYRVAEEPFTPFNTSMLSVIGELLGVIVENYYLAREANKLATIQERQRLARDLHDAVSQSVYSLSLFARSARDAEEAGDKSKLADSLQQLEKNSINALREMRLLLYQLRSIALQEGNLEQALVTRLDMVERRLGIEAVLELSQEIDLGANVEQDLFRISTEALNNSLHYAEAKKVTVQMYRERNQLKLIIEDDGIGFEPARVRRGMGLQNIRERLLAYKGKLELHSQLGQGTRLYISIPESSLK